MTNLATIAVDATILGAIDYLRIHKLTADFTALAECCRAWCKAKLPEAMADAQAALDAGMDDIASATFIASMRNAGIEAAKESATGAA